MSFTETNIEEDEITEVIDKKQLILYNDDINSFQWVIECLMDILGFTLNQAEQSALLAHERGKIAIKSGDYDTLKPYHEEFGKCGITTAIE